MASFSDPADLNGWTNITRLCSNTKPTSITGSKYGYWQEKKQSILKYIIYYSVFTIIIYYKCLFYFLFFFYLKKIKNKIKKNMLILYVLLLFISFHEIQYKL